MFLKLRLEISVFDKITRATYSYNSRCLVPTIMEFYCQRAGYMHQLLGKINGKYFVRVFLSSKHMYESYDKITQRKVDIIQRFSKENSDNIIEVDITTALIMVDRVPDLAAYEHRFISYRLWRD